MAIDSLLMKLLIGNENHPLSLFAYVATLANLVTNVENLDIYIYIYIYICSYFIAYVNNAPFLL